jgi:Glycoside hydrolase family 44
MPRLHWSEIFLVLALPCIVACAKAPPSTSIPYGGQVGTGKDWNSSVDHVELTIDPGKAGRSISPLIYGYNGVKDPARYGVGSIRAGGNRFTAYNWENNASNAGNDFMFQSDGYLVTGSTMPDVPGEAVRPTLDAASKIDAAVILTIPTLDYVAADKSPAGDVTKAGADYLTTRFKQNRPSNAGMAMPTPDTTDAFVYQNDFVTWVAQTFPSVPVLFSMDNEPDLWNKTHKEIHPDPVTYDEVVTRNAAYARAVKSVWPLAPVLGFVSYGWQGYMTLDGAPDAGAKGVFVDYYLRQMKTAGDDAGMRLVDYLDLHWYPEARGMGASGNSVRVVFDPPDAGAGVVDARVQAPRSLWDPGYREQSWIVTTAGGPIALIPRMQEKIDNLYPGTKLAFTEWNYGGGGDMSGAVATADVLGIFGREGVGAANIWPTGPGQFTLGAIGAFRNFDGAGARFGDTAISAQTTSIYSSSVYASVDSTNPSRLVIVAINKRSAPTTATVRIVGDSASVAAAVWVLAGTTPIPQPASSLVATAPGVFAYEMPALSVSVLVPSPEVHPTATSLAD